EAFNENQLVGDCLEGKGGGSKLHVLAGALGPPVFGLDAVGPEHATETQRRLVRIDGLRGFLRQQRERFHPGQCERNTGAPEKMTSRRGVHYRPTLSEFWICTDAVFTVGAGAGSSRRR